MSYHCSIYAIDDVEIHNGVSFKPFKGAEDMTMHLGITVEQWQRRQKAKASRFSSAKRTKTSKVSALDKLLSEIDL